MPASLVVTNARAPDGAATGLRIVDGRIAELGAEVS